MEFNPCSIIEQVSGLCAYTFFRFFFFNNPAHVQDCENFYFCCATVKCCQFPVLRMNLEKSLPLFHIVVASISTPCSCAVPKHEMKGAIGCWQFQQISTKLQLQKRKLWRLCPTNTLSGQPESSQTVLHSAAISFCVGDKDGYVR